MSRQSYRLVRSPRVSHAAPDLDDSQQAVVDHDEGPLLVLAGPGTGKTTTLVEAVVDRIDRRAVDPERVLVLTFSRRAAAELRERITGRLDRTMREPLARTFHSYAFGLLRREAASRGEPVPRLLTGPEQDLVIRELLRGDASGEGIGWPPELRPALLTRGFAQELRDLLMRCFERGIDAPTLARLGRQHARPDWVAASRFLTQYDQVTALRDVGAYDSSELIRSAVGLLAQHSPLSQRERAAYDWVFVDEYQDTDPSQEELLAAITPRGGNLVVVGDPNQSIYAFRGADVRCIRRFPESFPTATGDPAPTLALRVCRRSAPELVEVGEAVAARLTARLTRSPLEPAPGRMRGIVDVVVAASQSQEAALVAGVLRRAHVMDGIPWSRMAVLVRSTRGRLSTLRRGLLAAGVPLGVPGEEIPLAEQPGARALLELVGVALRPETLDERVAEALLTGPVAGLDALGLRRLRRKLRGLELAAGGRRSSAPLLIEAVDDARQVVTFRPALRDPVERVHGLIEVARATAGAGGSIEAILWSVWSGSGLSGRWQAASFEGGVRGAAADRDLDAVMALFEAAARFVDRLPKAGPEVFLDDLRGQQIPGDTLAAQAPQGDVVRVMTAHAAKGLEWDLVVVAGVQDSIWPDLRVRGSVLGSDDLLDVLDSGSVVSSAHIPRLLDEERRLFYVAATRARERLFVTAVHDNDEGDQPSRFLADVALREDAACPVKGVGADGVFDPRRSTTLAALRARVAIPTLTPLLRDIAADDSQPAATRTRAVELADQLSSLLRSLDLGALVAELRATATDGSANTAVRKASATLLARLAADGVAGADPDDWYAAAPLSDERPLRDGDQQVAVSPSKVDSFLTCRLRWLLESVGAAGAPSGKQSVGTLVHDLALKAADDDSLDEEALLAILDERWDTIDLGSPWYAAQQRERARGMIRKLSAWLANNPRKLVGAELEFAVELGRARLGGRVDRLELDEAGRGHVVDFKTGGSKPKDADVPRHPQLGAYQAAVDGGGFAHLGVTEAGGARLVPLGLSAKSVKDQVQQPLADDPDPLWAREQVVAVAEAMAGVAFEASENGYCEMCPVRSSCPVQGEGRQVGQG